MKRTTFTRKQIQRALGKRKDGKTLSDREKAMCAAFDAAAARLSATT